MARSVHIFVGDKVSTPKGLGYVERGTTWRDRVVEMSDHEAKEFSQNLVVRAERTLHECRTREDDEPDPFALEFIQALETSLNAQDALRILKITEQAPRKEEEAAIDLVGKGIRNLVIWPSGGGFPTDTFRRLRIVGTNMVFFDRMLPGRYADFVGLDNRHAVVTLLKEALRNGRERFLFISHKGLEADSDRQREEAFRLYCEQEGLPHRLVRVPWRGDVSGAIRRHRRAWFVEAKNQAVICVNDAVALHVRSAGGGKIDVYGIDGLPEARAAGIPTCEQPMKAMARKAIELLWAQQQQSTKWMARQVYCRGRLIRRKT